MLAFISIFGISFVGLYIIHKLDERKIIDYLLLYPLLLMITNSINILFFRIFKGHVKNLETIINFDTTFFVLYCVVGILINIMFAIAFISFEKVTDISLKVDTNENKKDREKIFKRKNNL